MTDLWAENIATYRANQGANQARARTTLESHGVKFADLSPEQATEIRDQMLKEQDAVAKELKISAEVVKLMTADLASAA